jgi:hypothetical protein
MLRYRRYTGDSPKIKVIDINNTYYRGTLKKSLKHGFGVYIDEKGTYTGEWYKDKRHGDGVMEYTDGSIYMGEWYHDTEYDGILEYTDGQRVIIKIQA